MASMERGVLNEYVPEWDCSTPVCASACRVGVEMIVRDTPQSRVLLDRGGVSPSISISEQGERLGPATCLRNRISGLGLVEGKSSWHERMFV